MDSLESSMDTAHQEKLKGIRQKQIDLPAARGKGWLVKITLNIPGNYFTNSTFLQKIIVIMHIIMFTESRLFQDPIDEDEEYSVSVETGAEDGRLDVVTTEGVGTGFLNTSAANELAALQEALRAAHMVGTNDSRNLGFQGKIWIKGYLTSPPLNFTPHLNLPPPISSYLPTSTYLPHLNLPPSTSTYLPLFHLTSST